MQTVKKRFDIAVTDPNMVYSKTFELDKNIAAVTGLLFTSDKDDLLYYRGSQKVEINKEEILPENYESKLLLSGINVAPDNRYYDIGNQPAGNGTIKVEYRDMDDSRAVFTPYRVSLYAECILQ
jgi:hypothetical protein